MSGCLTARVVNSLSKQEKYKETIIHDRTRKPSSKKMDKIKRSNYDSKYGNQRQFTESE
jgi:hypothetical protein